MTIAIIITTLLVVVLVVWLSTLGYIETPAGETMMVGWFSEPNLVVGNNLPTIEITTDLIDLPTDELEKIQPRLDVNGPLVWKIFPRRKILFDYRFKHYKTIGEIKRTGGTIIWQPEIPLDVSGNPLYEENLDSVIALGEWKESNKLTLWREEREEIFIKFTSKELIHGGKKALMRLLVWHMPLFTKSVRNAKDDIEKIVTDMFQEWAREKGYFESIRGISFAAVNHKGVDGKQFIKDLNKEIYKRGFIVQGIDLFDDYIYQGSQDVYDAYEKKFKEGALKDAAKIDAEIAKISGEGQRDKELAVNEGRKNLLEIENTAAIAKDKGLKQNEIDQHKQNLENERLAATQLFEDQTIIAVTANGDIIDKIIEAKMTPDATTEKKYLAIKDSKITTYVETGGNSSSADNLDEKLTTQVAANLITLPKIKGDEN